MQIVNVTRESGVPLIGCIAFGVIDRGTNLLQVRPTSVCNLKCVFCSTRANDLDFHPCGFVVEREYLVSAVKKIAEFKGADIEANMDSVGEVMTYPEIVELIRDIKNLPAVKRVSMQSNGCLITKQKLDGLVDAGLDHLNLSINSLDKEKARFLAGVPAYDVNKIKKLAEYASGKLSLLIAPVWMPGVNDEDIIDIIHFAKSIGARLGIQKYEVYRYSRKIKGGKNITWWKFYNQLKKWEKEFDVKLVLRASDMGIHKAKRLPEPFKKKDVVHVDVKLPGWIKGQMIGVAKDRCISINNCHAKIGDRIKVRILETKNNLFVAETL